MKNISKKRKGTLGKTENAFYSVNTMPIRPKIRCVLPKLPKMNITNDSYESLVIGGEGEIRTLEPFYRLHDFQSCALDQLRDFSTLFLRLI